MLDRIAAKTWLHGRDPCDSTCRTPVLECPMDTTNQVEKFLGSYAGMDGGNADAPVWICGIEHGGGFEDLQTALKPEKTPGCWNAEFRGKNPTFATWQYHQKVAKLLVAARRLRSGLAATATVDGWSRYMAEELYERDGETFKLNLYPLASPSVNALGWADAYASIPALRDKKAYYEACRTFRFPFIREIRRRFGPKLILGTGKGYRDRFVEAFGFDGCAPEQVTLETPSVRRHCTVYRDSTGTLIVSPFFGGRHGMNSDAVIIKLAILVVKELSRFAPAWEHARGSGGDGEVR